jgi:outer membrane protein OmpA-like peptidoglycan-associated protein
MKKRFLICLAVAVLAFMPLYAQSAGTDAAEEDLETSEVGEVIYNEFVALKTEIGELKVLVVGLKNEVFSKRSELDGLQSGITETSKALASLREQNAVMRAEVDETSRLLATLQQEKVAAQNELAKVKAELIPLQEQRDATRSELAAAQANLAILAQQKNQLEGEINANKAALVVAQNNQKAELKNDTKQPPVAPGRANSGAAPPQSIAKATPAKTTTKVGDLLDAIYFNPDSTELGTRVMPALDVIGGMMKENKGMKITVRGYSAPAGTPVGQLSVSRARAQKTAAYLVENFDISADRITIEWVGAAEKPKNSVSSDMRMLRVVEVSSAA